MKASEFDRTFDAGADVSGQVDWSKAQRPSEQAKRVNVDFPHGLWPDWTVRRGTLA